MNFMMDILKIVFQKNAYLYTLMSQDNKPESAISTSSLVPSKEPKKYQPIFDPPSQVYSNRCILAQVHLVIQLYPNRWSTYIDPSGVPGKKPSHIPSSGQSDHPRSSTSVSMSVNISPFPIITPTTLPSDVPSEKQMMLVLWLMNSWMDI